MTEKGLCSVAERKDITLVNVKKKKDEETADRDNMHMHQQLSWMVCVCPSIM
jgi:hypothetical protein